MLQIDLTKHKIVSTFFNVPSGYLGGAVWGSPAVNPAGTTLYYGTGNCNGTLSGARDACPQTGSYTDALVALDISTEGQMTFKGAFLLPSQPTDSDWDFGSTPTVFDDGNGHTLVGAACKDGNFYAVDADTMHLAWSAQLTPTNGGNPPGGDGSISPAAYAEGLVFAAAANGPDHSVVIALRPADGQPKWTTPISVGTIIAPVTYANGLVYVGTGSQSDGATPTIQVLRASDGMVVKSIEFPSSSSSPNFISDSITPAGGQLFFGLGSGTIFAYGL
jgi:hypothetical protein